MDSGAIGPRELQASEWIVQLKTEAAASIFDVGLVGGLLDTPRSQFSVISGLGAAGSVLVRGEGVLTEDVRADLEDNKNVDSFGLNSIIEGQSTIPNDPDFVSSRLPGLSAIDAPLAWDSSRGSTSVVVGVVDSGIDATHPDLYLNIWLNQGEIPEVLADQLVDIDGDNLITFYDLNNVTVDPLTLELSQPDFAGGPNAPFVSDKNANGRIDALDLLADPNWADGRDTDGNTFFDDFFGVNFRSGSGDPFPSNTPSDELGHGTHVAGTIGAIGNNGVGVVGVNWQTSLMSLRILDNHNQADAGAALRAVNYATAMRNQFRLDNLGRVESAQTFAC